MHQSEAVPRLIVEPADALNDIPISVRIEGLKPGQPATIASVLHNHDDSVRWSGDVRVEANKDGQVDLATDAPLSGNFTSADPNGLIWSLRPETGANGGRAAAGSLDPLTLSLSLLVDGDDVDRVELIRRAVDASVSRQEIRENGLFINLFLPHADGPHPTVVVLGGSGGGFADNLAALYASHGYAAVSVAYFGIEGLPAELFEIPLEYFEGVIAWIEQHPELDTHHLAISGISRGGELALLLASRYPVFRSVVAYVPSGYIWGAVSPSEDDDPDAFPSWTYGGKPLPYVARIRNDAASANDEGVVDLTPAFLTAIENRPRADAATIEVEKINGPVMLISGRADALWPSAEFSDQIVERLNARGFDFEVINLAYNDAGHTIGPPITPATITQGHHPIRKITIGYGGSPESIARARSDSWQHVLSFLDRHVKQRVHNAGSIS